MSMGTGTGTSPWVWVRTGMGTYGYGYETMGTGTGTVPTCQRVMGMGAGTGSRPWVRVRVWVRILQVCRTFPFLEMYNTDCVSNSETLFHIPLWKLYFTYVIGRGANREGFNFKLAMVKACST